MHRAVADDDDGDGEDYPDAGGCGGGDEAIPALLVMGDGYGQRLYAALAAAAADCLPPTSCSLLDC